MDAKSTRAWLEKICGAQAIDVAGLAADQARREELIAAHISGPEFETLKAETRDFLLSIAFSGKEIKRPKLMRGIDEKIVFGEMDLEFDTGADWLAFLDASYGGTGFSDGPGRVLAEAPWRPCPPAPGLPPLARDWVRRHRRAA